MQPKYIKTLAEVLGVDLQTLEGMTNEQKLSHLEMLQLQEVLSI